MSKKGKLIYKLITGITLFAPLPLYLFLSATLFNITPDYTISGNIAAVDVYKVDGGGFITTSDKEAVIGGTVTYNADYDTYGIFIEDGSDAVIKIGRNYYSISNDTDGDESNGLQYGLTDVRKFEVQKQQKYKIPLSLFISILGVLLVALIVTGKMQWQKSHPRLAAFIALLTGTTVLYIINTIVSSLLGVFLVATVSWAAYCLEFLVKEGKIKNADADQKESNLIQDLKRALQE